MLGRPKFALLALLPSLNFCAFFLYIAAAPAFLVDLLGVSTWGFAWLFVPMIAGIMIGAFLSGPHRRTPVAAAHDPHRLRAARRRRGRSISRSCTSLPPFVAWNVLPIFIFTIGSSLIMPSVTLLLLDLFPTMRGMTSSLQGFVQFALGAVVAGRSRRCSRIRCRSLAWGMAAFTAASFALWLAYQRRARTTLKEWTP